jgi:hypothetical protein
MTRLALSNCPIFISATIEAYACHELIYLPPYIVSVYVTT